MFTEQKYRLTKRQTKIMVLQIASSPLALYYHLLMAFLHQFLYPIQNACYQEKKLESILKDKKKTRNQKTKSNLRPIEHENQT